ncbi:YjbH domain-containing protein [Frateuria sp. STR12]|uniref:YjbH domain-containing protein n=1 Tax=Frateuria hangzhouensis TaxID=2995589 RepID=UPI00226098ED|nr:YjbH domain-containing protein [Frateuria sp. STR12]MCX7515276.1 YjbH domain-containing protein [Frateuria sp. STR12]
MKRRRLYLCLLPLLGAPAAQAQDVPVDSGWADGYTQSDFGGAGLLQTPTARMNAAGEGAITGSRVEPYSRFTFTLQPLDWLEGSFRYTNVTNRYYGTPSFSGRQHYKDKAIDLKLRLWQESRWLPALAVGGHDIGGTGLFSGEYVVASKRLDRFDVSLGLGWGYLGAAGDVGNPLGLLDDRFRHRPAVDNSDVGDFNGNYFRGRAALFGGVEYRLPGDRWRLKLEYEGNDYRHEPQRNDQPQRSRLNLGVAYRLAKTVDLSVGWERGNTAMFGLTLHTNLARGEGPPKLLDPPPEPLAASPVHGQADWAEVSARLADNADVQVESIRRDGRELIVTGEPGRFRYPAKTLGRTARILDNAAAPQVDWFTLVSTSEGMPVVQASVHRGPFGKLVSHDLAPDDFRRSVVREAPAPAAGEVLYRAPLDRYRGNVGMGLGQTVGGPDAFILYQLFASYDAEYRFSRHAWLSGQLNANLLNNYDQFRYDAPSNLPRVRTWQRRYLTTSRLNLSNLQFNAATRLGTDLYGMAYAGLLESMYGGAGGEVLYRPFGQRWALGANLNWVRQRGFAQHFGWRDYRVVTGHVTAYVDTGIDHVLATVSLGRYLARDWGGTLDLSRAFDNGVRMGAYATFTNVSSRQFGEGSFDKGIYVSVPFDLMLPKSSPASTEILWRPLTRDGGAMLLRRYSLYGLTGERDAQMFEANFGEIAQ